MVKKDLKNTGVKKRAILLKKLWLNVNYWKMRMVRKFWELCASSMLRTLNLFNIVATLWSGTIIMPTLQLRKLRLGGVKQLAQGHSTSVWQRTWSVNLEPLLLTHILYCLLKDKWGARVRYPKQKVAWLFNNRVYVWFCIKTEISLFYSG